MIETCSVTVVGDGVVGKTCLLFRYTQNKDPVELPYVPTVFENYAETITVDNHNINLQLWDTAGQEEYEKLRVLAYEKTDVFVLCYDMVNLVTLENGKNNWTKEMREYSKSPIILVGTKLDLVRNYQMVYTEGQKAAKAIKAAAHIVTSSKTGEGVREVFQEAVRIAIRRSNRRCTIL